MMENKISLIFCCFLKDTNKLFSKIEVRQIFSILKIIELFK